MTNAWKRLAGLCAGAAMLAGGPGTLRAMEPFDNWANPPGLYVVDYPTYYNSQALNDKNGDPKTIPNADLHVYQNVVRMVYYGDSYLVSAYVPVGRVEILNRHSGIKIGDPTLVGGWFFVNDKKSNMYAALGFKVDVPAGAYDPSAMTNMGKNVWRYRPLVTFAKLAGPVDLEATVTYSIWSENKEPAPPQKNGNEVLFESFAGMFFSPKLLVGAHFNTRSGKDQKVNSMLLPDSGPKVTQVGASVTWLASPRFNALLEVLPDTSAKNDFQGVLWLTRITYKIF